MSTRTTPGAVKALLTPGRDYRAGTDLTPFVETAAVTVDDAVAFGVSNGVVVTTSRAEILERWIAAHCYQMSDKGYKQRRTGKSSGSYQVKVGSGFEATTYGQMAKRLDPTGYLAYLDDQKPVVELEIIWLGKPPSTQIPYVNRM